MQYKSGDNYLKKELYELIKNDETIFDFIQESALDGMWYWDLEKRDIANQTIYARTGIEAVEICRNNPDLDLVLMDIQMPKMDGYEATKKIREFNNNVIIIAQTAYALTGDRDKSIEAGCDDHISKPINRDTLISLIETHLNKYQEPKLNGKLLYKTGAGNNTTGTPVI